jgi:Icc-related predicted phosphoesterase
VSCGDVSFDYLEALVTVWRIPLLYVPGNHDPDLRARPESAWAGRSEGPGPGGCTSIDGRVADVGGVRFAGLGGCLRYKPGPNQYGERAMSRRVKLLRARLAMRRMGDGRDLDVLVAHAPPRGCGDDEDAPHRGFAALHDIALSTSPRLLLHGHIHPYGRRLPDRRVGVTDVINVVPYRLITLPDRLGGPAQQGNDRLGRGGTT